jgi:ATP-dependent RNA helicase DDX52/ROK1
MSSELFLALTKGACFDSKKYKQDIDTFKKGEASKIGDIIGADEDAPISSFIPVSSLDFFGNTKETQKKPQKRKREDLVSKEQRIEEKASFIDANADDLDGKSLRQKYQIYVTKGTDAPEPITNFSQLQQEPYNFRPYLINNIPYRDTPPTPVQMQSIPAMMQGRDLLVAAPTGSGKTAAYVLPILAALREPKKEGFRCIVIAPTRILAEQIHRQFQIFAHGKDWRVRSIASDTISAEALSSKRNDILIATPKKLISCLQDIEWNHLEKVVFDEADRLFDMGFAEQIDEILAHFNQRAGRYTKHLFSATIPLSVEQLAATVLNVSPLYISVGVKNAGACTINQKLLFVGSEQGKLLALRERIRAGLKPPVLIFVQSIERAKQLYNELLFDQTYQIDYIHGKRSDAQTKVAVQNFRLGKTWALICTDVMARGLDFLGVSCVINYDFPVSMISYVHRIGRTGRAGREGEAITFFTYEDLPLLRNIAEVMRKSGCEVPDWIFEKVKKVSNKKLSSTVVENALNEQKKKKGLMDGGGLKRRNKRRKQSEIIVGEEIPEEEE